MNKVILQAPMNCNRKKLNEYFNYNYRVPFKTVTDVWNEITHFLSEQMDENDEISVDEFELWNIDEFCTAINDEMLNEIDYWYIPVKVEK